MMSCSVTHRNAPLDRGVVPFLYSPDQGPKLHFSGVEVDRLTQEAVLTKFVSYANDL